jgi:hypothetical protein
LVVAELAVETARVLGRADTLARAELERGWALLELARLTEACSALAEAGRLAAVIGDLNTQSHALLGIGAIYEDGG